MHFLGIIYIINIIHLGITISIANRSTKLINNSQLEHNLDNNNYLKTLLNNFVSHI